MEQKTTTLTPASSQRWERLEAFVREQIQRFIEAVLEEEVTSLLGRPNRHDVPRWMPPRGCAMVTASPAD